MASQPTRAALSRATAILGRRRLRDDFNQQRVVLQLKPTEVRSVLGTPTGYSAPIAVVGLTDVARHAGTSPASAPEMTTVRITSV